MNVFEMKLPDVGEGVAEAEIVAWLVAVGDEVTPDSVLAEVLTDKATVEVSPPVSGTIVALHGEPGDVVAVGSRLVSIEVVDDAADDGGEASPPGARGASEPESDAATASRAAASDAAEAKVRAAPAVRTRAADLGIDLATISGSGPDGRVVHADLDAALTARAPRPRPQPEAADGQRVVAVRGVRRRIAERLSTAWNDIPHITYVEAVDVTEVERLRDELNSGADGIRVTLLPLLVRAIAVAARDQPEINAHYDHAAETLTVFDAVHAGIATHTDRGLMVPVVRHADAMGVRELATEIARVTDAARTGRATREELSGSSVTITSLGAIGGVVTTPILNPPEVAIVGVNKIEMRPVWTDGSFQPRQVMNLSSSFDHRVVDGWDGATFVQRLKTLLEVPALLFIDV